jgi:hypothetical protein
MALTIIAVAGSTTANSYVTLAEANTYMEMKPDATWNEVSSTEDLKKAALIYAAMTLNDLPWMGVKLQNWPEGHPQFQPLAWPRRGKSSYQAWSTDNDGMPSCFDNSGNVIVPQQIKRAQCEQANYLLTSGGLGDVADRIRLQQQGVRSFSIPGLTEQYSGTPRGLYQYAVEALAIIRPYLMEGVKLHRA